MRLLIADDEKEVELLLAPALAQHGFADVTFVRDPAVSVQKIQELQPDVVILDINFNVKDFDGFEVLRRAKLLSVQTRFIMSSTYTEFSGKAIAAGADGFLPKPTSMDKMIKKINEIAGKAGLA
ncbi:MAG: response regulator transcription factor [Candidatus Omnitrophica bacterium]|nr:response regulator transcription factor [Candidatus Omnitrophota bacterium]